MIRLRREELDRARAHFEHALARLGNLGTLFAKYEIAAQASLPITSDIFAHVFPRERGTRLALVEIAQLEGRHADAMGHIARLMEIDATDPVVLLSFAELALDTTDDRALMDRVVRATVHVEKTKHPSIRRSCFIAAAHLRRWESPMLRSTCSHLPTVAGRTGLRACCIRFAMTGRCFMIRLAARRRHGANSSVYMPKTLILRMFVQG